MRMSWRIIVIVVLIHLSIQTSRALCPSPPVTYAVEGGSVSLCWKISVDITDITNFSIVAIEKPVQMDLEKISSTDKDGQFLRTYPKHNGLYVGKAKVYADIPAGNLVFQVTNYTSAMSNVYCALYEMNVINNIVDCTDHPLLLRTYVPTTAATTVTTAAPTTNATETPRPTKGRPEARTDESYFIPLIIVSCFLGALFIVLTITVLCYRKCIKSIGNNSSENKMKTRTKQVEL